MLDIDLNAAFGLAGQAAMIGWVILMFLPRRWKYLNWIPHFIIPFGLSILYAALFLPTFWTIEGGGFGSLEQVKTLLSNDAALLAGWVHYLAFDLFIGAWIAHRSDEIGLSRILQFPILLATFMMGPIGLLAFLCLRSFYKKELSV